jgi:tricorn protease interacting factor F2/3
VLEYELALDVDVPGRAFRGDLTIRGLPAVPTTELDCEGLTVESVHLADRPVAFTLDSDHHRLTFPGPEDGSTARIRYAGSVSSGTQTGFFVARLGNATAFVTQMEAIGCRRLLPCLDRPDAKAVFTLRVRAPAGLQVISNTEGRSREADGDRREWEFPPSPTMSSYLLFLGVGAFEEAETAQGNLRIISATPPGHVRAAENARAMALAVVRGYEEYFQIRYPLEKLHLVVISDFWGAMENWGAILGADDNLLLDDATTPAARRFAFETITHEIAHQWFGNLVTLRTWDDLWLNESFATFAVPRLHERLRLRADPWGEFVVRTRPGDLIDSLPSTHPVKPSTLDPLEMLAFADEITYFKGSRLLRMIESFVGPEAFRAGITRYLNAHAYGNATSDDLWAALEGSSAQPVVPVMRAWIERPGHPVIDVHDTGTALEIRQRRFGFLPGTGSDPPWPVPLTIEEGGRRRSVLFDTRTTAIPHAPGAEVRLDPDRAGFFRLLFEPERRAVLRGGASRLSPGERYGMVHDAGAFLLSGDLGLAEYLDTLRAVEGAEEFATIEDSCQFLEFVDPLLLPIEAFRTAARSFYHSQLDRIGLVPRSGESDLVPVLRESVTWGLVRCDEAFARSLLPRMDSLRTEPAALRQAILGAYAAQGPRDSALERLFAIVRGPESDLALCATLALRVLPSDAERAEALGQALAPGVRLFLASRLLPALAAAPSFRAPVWRWLTEQLREFERRGRGGPLLAQLLLRTLPRAGLGRLEEVRHFFAAASFPEGNLGARKGLDYLETLTRLQDRLVRSGDLRAPARGPPGGPRGRCGRGPTAPRLRVRYPRVGPAPNRGKTLANAGSTTPVDTEAVPRGPNGAPTLRLGRGRELFHDMRGPEELTPEEHPRGERRPEETEHGDERQVVGGQGGRPELHQVGNAAGDGCPRRRGAGGTGRGVERVELGDDHRREHGERDRAAQRLQELDEPARLADIVGRDLVLDGEQEDGEGEPDAEAEREEREDDPSGGQEPEAEDPDGRVHRLGPQEHEPPEGQHHADQHLDPVGDPGEELPPERGAQHEREDEDVEHVADDVRAVHARMAEGDRHEDREERGEREEDPPDEERRRAAHRHDAVPEQAQRDEGLARAPQLPDDEHPEEHDGTGEEPEDPRVGPRPTGVRDLQQRVLQRADPTRQEARAHGIERPTDLGVERAEGVQEEERPQDADGEIDVEHPAPAEVGHDRRADERTGDGRDPEDAGEQSGDAGPGRRREGDRDDRDPDGEEAAGAEPLHGAEGDELGERLAEPREHRAEDEDHEPDEEDVPPAPEVGELPEYRDRHGRGDDVGGDHGGARVDLPELGEDGVQRRQDHELVERPHQEGQEDAADHEGLIPGLPRPVDGGRGRRRHARRSSRFACRSHRTPSARNDPARGGVGAGDMRRRVEVARGPPTFREGEGSVG